MALGSANTSAQARGKNIATKRKRRREIMAAKDYISFQGSALQSSAACPLNNADVNITYYHNGSSGLPGIGEKIYTTKRANDRFILTQDNKHIKAVDRGRYYSIEYKSGVVKRVTSCP